MVKNGTRCHFSHYDEALRLEETAKYSKLHSEFFEGQYRKKIQSHDSPF